MKLFAVGLGPGDSEYIAPEAKGVILQSDVIVGYTGYIELIPELIKGKEVIATGMTAEVQRCEAAIDEALKGKVVCVVSSGDSGIYGMAALLYELAEKHPQIDIAVIPGITAGVSAAALLGSPLTNDFAVISLSDLLTPWEVIKKRLTACGEADMVICIYNPQSKKRQDYLKKATDIILNYKPAETPCGYVRNAFRGKETESKVCYLSDLSELAKTEVDMFTTVIIGNSCTKIINGKLVTTRGYKV